MRVAVCAVLLVALAGCRSSDSAAPARAGFTPFPGAASTVSPTPSGPRTVVITGTSFAGVPLGTSTAEGTRRLTAELGRPTVFDGGCDLGGPGYESHDRTLSWGNISAVFSDQAADGHRTAQQLTGWVVVNDKPRRFRLELPYGIQLGASLQLVERRTGGTPGPTFDESVVTVSTKQADYDFEANSDGGVLSISHGLAPCE